jgi:hypothetical protein
MNGFDFVSHESYPDDEYTKESVVLCIEKKHRVTYVRKKMQNGGMFWDVISASVKLHGEKKYLKSYSQDSNFLHEDIKAYLDSRGWEKRGYTGSPSGDYTGGSVAQSKSDEEQVPF